jgi:hypothetical protein
MMRPSPEEENRLVDRCLVALEKAVHRCRTEDVRYTGIPAALSFLERLVPDKRPFEKFWRALEDFDTDESKADAREMAVRAALDDIKRVIGRK